MVDYFDRCIDLVFYDKGGNVMYKLLTPPTGPKPDILVEYKMVDEFSNFDTNITVTNLDNVVKVLNVDKIECTMYYKGSTGIGNLANNMVGQSFLYSVLDVKSIKGPPDRQTQFVCKVPSSDPNKLGAIWRYTPNTDSDGKPAKVTVDTLIKEWIKQYNDAVKATDKSTVFVGKSVLKTEVDYSAVDEKVKSIKVYPPNNGCSMFVAFREITNSLVSIEHTTNGDKQYARSYWMDIQAGQVRVVATSKQGVEFTNLGVKNAIDLKYVVNANANAALVNVDILFDPRIRVWSYCKIRNKFLLSKGGIGQVGQGLLPLQESAEGKEASSYFQVLPGFSTVKFGTVRENTMHLYGANPQQAQLPVNLE